MGDLAEAVATVVRRPVELTGAGRTDAGVHAWGQVVSGDLPAATDLDDLARRLNKLCAPAIAVRDAAWADDDFDARFSATLAALPLRRLERARRRTRCWPGGPGSCPSRWPGGRCRRRATR